MNQNSVQLPPLMVLLAEMFSSGFKAGQAVIPHITFTTAFHDVESISNKEINIKKDSEKNYIEFDINKMKHDKFYFIEYGDAQYAVRKIGNDQVAFYDVVE